MADNILILGKGRSGKDEAGRFLNDHLGIPYGGSTSWAGLPYIAKALGTHPQLAWEHRHEQRGFWKDFYDNLRRDDPLFLVKLALKTGRVVTGLRGAVEVKAARASGLFKHILWIERPGTPDDPTLEFGEEVATEIIWNDGTLPGFHLNLASWAIHRDLKGLRSGVGLSFLFEAVAFTPTTIRPGTQRI